MEEYYRNGRMLMSLAGAVGRLVLAGKLSETFHSYHTTLHAGHARPRKH